MHLFKLDIVLRLSSLNSKLCSAFIVCQYTDRTGGHTNINVKRDGSWTRSNLDSASPNGWQVSTWINIVFLWSATIPVPFYSSFPSLRTCLSRLISHVAFSFFLYTVPSCMFTAHLFLVYNPGRVCTRFHGQRENYYPATLLRYLPCFLITIGAAAPTICVSRQLCVREPSVNVVPITMPAPSAKTPLIVWYRHIFIMTSAVCGFLCIWIYSSKAALPSYE